MATSQDKPLLNDRSLSLEEVIITDQLLSRPSRPPNFEVEAKALKRLSKKLIDPNAQILQELTDIILEICQADSAGISIEEKEGSEDIFRWYAISGQLKPFAHGTMPRASSPCGIVVERRSTLLIDRPIRHWTTIDTLGIPIHEVLLVPFYRNGKAVGTIWAVSHRSEKIFVEEDRRLLNSLADVTALAVDSYRTFQVVTDKQARTIEEERARREEAEQERAEIASIVNQSTVATAVLMGPEHRFYLANKLYKDMFGVRDNPVGKKAVDVMPEAKSQGYMSVLDEVYETGLPFEGHEAFFERTLDDGKKKAFYLDFTYAPKKNARGEVNGVIATIVDVTERVLTQKRHEENEHLLAVTANAIPTLLSYIDSELRYRFVNSAYEEWFGISPDQIAGQKVKDVLGEQAFSKVESSFQRVLQGESVTFEGTLVYPNKTREIQALYRPDIDQSTGRVQGIVALVQDISEKKKIENELENARLASEAASQTKSAFLANMSHEIRTPLGAIMGFSDMARQPGATREEVASYLGIIDRNSVQVLRIIDDILDLAKVEAGRVELETLEFSLTEFIAEFSSLMNFRARENGILFEVQANTDLPDLICTDPTRLRQILTNAIGNAIKFTSKGKVTLHISFKDQVLEFGIEDTGRGISGEQAEQLFQAFVQADASTTRKFGGTGLGLVLTKRLCQLMGGDYVLERSQLAVGSRFKASIQVKLPPGSRMIAKDQVVFETVVLPVQASVGDRLGGVKVLLVEDSPDNQVLVRLMLERQGANLDVASDGLQGVNKAMNNDYDVVLMDIQMPQMDGHEAVQTLRSNGYKKPIIALTAHAMKEEAVRAKASGFTDFLTKPIQREALIEMVSELASQYN